MLVPIPKKIIDKVKFDPEIGYFLTDPHTEEDQRVLEKFLKDVEDADKNQVILDPELLKEE